MILESDNEVTVRGLNENENIPYDLLLLADETIEAINKYIFDAEIYVCERNNKTIATYVLKIINNDSVEIKNIAVDIAFQGRGIGSSLLKNASENAAKRGFKSLFIGTGDNSFKQLALYQKSGFKEFKIIKDFFIDNYPEAIYENGKQLKDMVVLKKDI